MNDHQLWVCGRHDEPCAWRTTCNRVKPHAHNDMYTNRHGNTYCNDGFKKGRRLHLCAKECIPFEERGGCRCGL